MKFIETPLKGSFLIQGEYQNDERGFFGRMFCVHEFASHGLKSDIVQANHSKSTQKHTLRGLHYQIAPMEETKIVKCIKGRIFDVIVDIRKDSNSYGRWFGEELSENNLKMMYVPHGFAHGFLTLEEDSEIIYFVSQYYSKEFERGICWNDASIAINWPAYPKIISDRDQKHPQFGKNEE